MTETPCQTLYRVVLRVLPDAAGRPDVAEVETYLGKYAGERGRKWHTTYPDLRVERRDTGAGWLYAVEIRTCLETLNRLKWQDLSTDRLRVLSDVPVAD